MASCYDLGVPHIHEKIDFTVAAFIVFEHKVLMVNHGRYGLWLAPGGHVELDEDTDEALFREIYEETGYKPDEIKVLSPKPKVKVKGAKFLFTPNYMDIHEANAPHRHISLVYFVKVLHGKHIKSEEHLEVKWLSLNDFKSGEYKIPGDTKFFASEAVRLAQNT